MAKFQKGKSGNPAGRPKGILDRRAALNGFLMLHAESLIEKVVTLALSGDTQALRLCLDRLIPKLPNENININLAESDEHIETTKKLIDDLIKKHERNY
jgi:hypothetical protein